jgi:hypothetical protein
MVGGSAPAYAARELRRMAKGGAGSGNFDHAGRPGQIGGSAPSRLARGDATELYRWGNLAEVVALDEARSGRIVRPSSLDVTDRPEWYFPPPRVLPPSARSWVNHTYGRYILDRAALAESGWGKDPNLRTEGAWRWKPGNLGGSWREYDDAFVNNAYKSAIRGFEVTTLPEGGSLEQVHDILKYRLGREVPVVASTVRQITDFKQKETA